MTCPMRLGRSRTAIAAPVRSIRNGARDALFALKLWHGKMELRSLAHLALHPQPAAVNLHEMFGDGKTEAGASGFTGAGHIDAVKPFKDARLVCFRDPNAGIGDGENHFVLPGLRTDHDLSAGRSEERRVGKECR